MKKYVSVGLVICFLLVFENVYLGSCETVEKQDDFIKALSEIHCSDDLYTCGLKYRYDTSWEGYQDGVLVETIFGAFEVEEYTFDLSADCIPDGGTIVELQASLSSPCEQAWDVYLFIQ